MKINTHQRIINSLLLRSNSTTNLGLLNGKIGFSIFFNHLAKKTGNLAYEDYAEWLVDQTLKDVNTTISNNFSNGLSGICWGLNYLLQKKFIDTDDKQIFEEAINTMFQLDYKRPRLVRNYTDFYGYGLFYLSDSINEVGSPEIFQLIWEDLEEILQSNIQSGNMKLSSNFIISLLYSIWKIQKQLPHHSEKKIVADSILNFVLSNVNQNLNNYEYHYLKILLNNLNITYYPSLYQDQKKMSPSELAEMYGQAIFFSFIFPDLQTRESFASNFSLKVYKVFRDKIFLKKILEQPDTENSTFIQYAIAYYILMGSDTNTFPTKFSGKISIYIINRDNIAGQYGIGTYIHELTSNMKDSDLSFTLINLYVKRHEFVIEDRDNIENWDIPSHTMYNSSTINSSQYFQVVVTLIRIHISCTNQICFHLNSMRDYRLAVLLRETLACKILLVIHYIDWKYLLNEDISQLKNEMSALTLIKETSSNKYVLAQYKNEKEFFEYVDHIICLTNYARDILSFYYRIDNKKITIINNGVSDRYMKLRTDDKTILKEKYQITSDEKAILYAGRLDSMKGVLYLIKAFREVLKEEPNCRLWIVGDGSCTELFNESEGIWSKICFTGKVNRKTLFELYTLADVGVIPSLYEAFGYVPIEMMMHCLAIIVTATSGLNEIVTDGFTGIKVPIFNNGIDTLILAQKIIYLIQNPNEREQIGKNGRDEYLKRFTAKKMCKNLENCYHKLLI